MLTLQPPRNPYIIGRPINEKEFFFGRSEQLSFIDKNLRKGEKILLMHGQRRVGKSSLLHNIPKLIKLQQFAFVSFDLGYHSHEQLEYLLENLAETIVEQLGIDHNQIQIPRAKQIQEQKDIFCRNFLPQIDQYLSGKNLVLLLDEFDALNNNYIGNSIESLFKQLKSVVARNKKLFAIIFAGRKPADIPNLKKIFQSVPIAEVGLLDDETVKDLITAPAAGLLNYQPEAIQAIINLSAGHPYFTQIICFAIFSRARELEKWEVTAQDVEMIVYRAIELAEAGLAWYWDALSVPEKVVFSAIAEAQKIAIEKSDQNLKKDPLILLKNYHQILPLDVMRQLAKELATKEFLNSKANRVKIELVRRWLLQRHPLWQEIRELEKQGKNEIDTTSKKLISQQQDTIQNSGLGSLFSAENKLPKTSSGSKNNQDWVEVWVIAITTILGVAAIATFITLIYTPNSSNNSEKKQNFRPNTISTKYSS